MNQVNTESAKQTSTIHIKEPVSEKQILDKMQESRTEWTPEYNFQEFISFLGVSKSLIYRKEQEGVIPAPKKDARGVTQYRTYTPEDVIFTRKALQLPSIQSDSKVFVFYNKKGGTAKSTVSSNFAAYLACTGHKVLAIDMCGQGNMTSNLGVMPSPEYLCFADFIANPAHALEDVIKPTYLPNLDLIPGNSSVDKLNFHIIGEILAKNLKGNPYMLFREILDTFKDQYDFIVIDTSPTFDPRNINVLQAAETLIVPVQLAYEAILGLSNFFNDLIEMQKSKACDLRLKKILVLPTFNRPRNIISREAMAFIQTNYSEYITEAVIRESETFRQATSASRPIFLFDRRSPASADIVGFVRTVFNLQAQEGHLWVRSDNE